MMTKYSGICCYFGQWPAHFRWWLNSCRYNADITFLLVTDIPLEGYAVPENVRVIRKSFAEVCALIASKFPEIEVSLDRPYKLCDFKTAYGYIFQEYLQGYDYWGFYDIDTIWGKITQFIPENADNHLVKIFPCGHLCFIRNEAPWNSIYRLVDEVAGTPCRNNMEGKVVSNWKACFSSPDSHYYDEEGGLEPLFTAKQYAQYGGVDFDNILPPWRFNHFFSINYPEKSCHLVYTFDRGHLYRYYLKGLSVCRDEISYIHFSKRDLAVRTKDLDVFSIYPNRITGRIQWNVISLLMHGRKRYWKHLQDRIVGKLLGKEGGR